MPWAGGTFTRNNGTYSGSTVWQSDAAAAIKIRADRHDTHDQDIAQGINNCLTKDGQNSPTQHISWGGFKITNLGNGTAASDAAAYGQTITALGWSGATITATRAAGNFTVTVNAGNITSALGYTPVNKAGDAVNGPLTFPVGALSEGGNVAAIEGYTDNAAGTASIRVLRGSSSSTTGWVLRTKNVGADVNALLLLGDGSASFVSGIDASGTIRSSGSFGVTGSNLFLCTNGAGTVTLRPNGLGVTTNQATYNSSGNLTIAGAYAGASINVGSGFTVTKVTVSSSAPGTLAQGEIYFRTT